MCQMIVGIVIHILDHIWTMIPKHIYSSLYKYFESIKTLRQNGQILSFFHLSSLNKQQKYDVFELGLWKNRRKNSSSAVRLWSWSPARSQGCWTQTRPQESLQQGTVIMLQFTRDKNFKYFRWHRKRRVKVFDCFYT